MSNCPKAQNQFCCILGVGARRTGSGLGARASTRNLQSGGPNESSATALGAALVKKQAGRKPRPPRRPHGGLPAPWTHCFSKWGHVHLAEMINPELFHSDHMLRCQLNQCSSAVNLVTKALPLPPRSLVLATRQYIDFRCTGRAWWRSRTRGAGKSTLKQSLASYLHHCGSTATDQRAGRAWL